ncbi:UNVERIFIED_CONTAM: hypothetical protein Sangu_1331800 [Sesamum angustifolium]|uniref:Uncharacterized protein n=1 Tax=Sesamum angustifolium TaxID=2727405 RepID=A0AAW2N5J2_9LAMI
MATTSPDYDHHQKSFRIKHDDDKFFTRLLSKESSKSNPSFRVYYGDHVPSAVPFMWETRPESIPRNPALIISHSPTSSFSSLSWSSSSRSSFSDPVITPTYAHNKRRRTSSWSVSFDKSSCFGIEKENGEIQRRSVLIVKKALLSIVGRRSA